MEELILRIPERYPMKDDELFAFCDANKELRIERDEHGQLIIMAPSGGITGNINFKITGIFGQWVEKDEHLGYGSDSATGFKLKVKSRRSPDVSWVKKEKWEALTIEDREKFAPICPEFVIELQSKSDSPTYLKEKMEKRISNGCSPGWPIDPSENKVYIYTSAQQVQETIGSDKTIAGGALLPGFERNFSRLK